MSSPLNTHNLASSRCRYVGSNISTTYLLICPIRTGYWSNAVKGKGVRARNGHGCFSLQQLYLTATIFAFNFTALDHKLLPYNGTSK